MLRDGPPSAAIPGQGLPAVCGWAPPSSTPAASREKKKKMEKNNTSVPTTSGCDSLKTAEAVPHAKFNYRVIHPSIMITVRLSCVTQ